MVPPEPSGIIASCSCSPSKAQTPLLTVLLALHRVGTAQTDTATVRLAAGEAPQPFVAETLTTPPVDPAVAVMESELDAPLHLPGSDQV
jgi:hypothetical protein